MSSVVSVTDAELKQKIEAGESFVVKVWAEWCGPCKMLTPSLESIANDYPEVLIVALDADRSEALGELGVRSVPTTIRFVNGKEDSRLVGNHPIPALKTFIGV